VIRRVKKSKLYSSRKANVCALGVHAGKRRGVLTSKNYTLREC